MHTNRPMATPAALTLAALLTIQLTGCHRATRQTTHHTRVVHHRPTPVHVDHISYHDHHEHHSHHSPHDHHTTQVVILPVACDLGHAHCANQYHFLNYHESYHFTEYHTHNHTHHHKHTHKHIHPKPPPPPPPPPPPSTPPPTPAPPHRHPPRHPASNAIAGSSTTGPPAWRKRARNRPSSANPTAPASTPAPRRDANTPRSTRRTPG